jgi:predicted nucleic acid-binding protein
MLVIDASCLYEVVAGGPAAEAIGRRTAAEGDQAAPHVVDVEVLGIIRRNYLRGHLDDTAARHSVEDLAAWPGERFPHRMLLDRAWELRASIRGWDAMYVALAEALGATLLTRDGRLAAATGPTCPIEVVPV